VKRFPVEQIAIRMLWFTAIAIEIALPRSGQDSFDPSSHTNGLSMRFVPVPGTQVLFSVYEIRVKDFRRFVEETGYVHMRETEDDDSRMWSLDRDGIKQRGRLWDEPGFPQTDDHPVVGVTWYDANAFCEWLTLREQSVGRLPSDWEYRLPSDHEWSVAAGLTEDPSRTAQEEDGRIKDAYPWGEWPQGGPPPPGSGNYAGAEADDFHWPGQFGVIEGYNDGYARTAPVGSFRPNRFGLCDMGGNVLEWCEDEYFSGAGSRVLRGASWLADGRDSLLSSNRVSAYPGLRYDFVGFRCVIGPSSRPVTTRGPPVTPKPSATPASTLVVAVPSKPAAATAVESSPTTRATTGRSGPANVELKDPVATVDGEKISKAQLEEAFDKAVQMTGVKVEDLTVEQTIEGYRQILEELITERLVNKRATASQQPLDDIITEKLVNKGAAGITVSQSDVDEQIAKIRAQFPSEEDFIKQLGQVGQSLDQLSDTIRKMLQQQRWLESKLAGKTEVTDEEAKEFYDENKTEFEQPETVEASHILFRVNKDAPKEVVTQKLKEAQSANARAKKGEDFAALAKELSEEPGAKESGGALGFFPKDRMVPEFADAAFSQKVGDIGDPVRTQFGWHVIKVTDKKPAGTLAYEEVKAQLIAYLKAKKQEEAAQEVLKSLRNSVRIEINLPRPMSSPSPNAPARN
jgi:parvulin-like peptidyl-prolyl isomerase/formylglycine-generating enzyme required for sulfatase activity